MDTCKVRNTNTGQTVTADILSKTDKSLRVVFKGTNIPITLTRTDVRKPYVGIMHKMEFTCVL
jgi:hypothetical protein